MKKKTAYILTLLLCAVSFTGFATTYYSGSSGALNLTASWWTARNGTGSHPANFTANGNIFQVINNTAPTLTGAWTISGTGSDVMLGDSTTSINFTIPSGFALTGTINVSNNATLTLQNATVPTLGTLAAASTVIYGGTATYTIPATTFGNLTYSSSSTTSIFSAGTTTITGNFSQTAATLTVGTTAATSYTVNVTGNFSVTGTGAFIMASNASASTTINVSGTTTLSSTGATILNFQSATATSGVSIFQANGNVSISGGTTNLIEWGTGTVAGNTFGVKGNLTISGTKIINTTSSTTAAQGFVFNGTGAVQTLSNTSTGAVASTECSYEVNAGAYVQLAAALSLGTGTTIHSSFKVISGGTLDCSTFAISGGSTSGGGVLVNSGGILVTANTGGVNSSVTATGSTFSGGANYKFNGSSAQVTGTSMPAAFVSPGSLTVNNSAGVTLSQATSFATGDTLNLENGTFTNGANLTMSSGAYLVRDNGTLSATPVTYSGVNLSYANLGNNALAITTGNEWPAVFTGGVTVNKTGATITLNGAKTLTGALTLTAGTLDASVSNYNISLTGNWTNNSGTSAFTARSGTITMNGAGAQVINGTSGTTFNALTINNSAGVTLSAATAFASGATLNLQNGAFTNGTNLTMSSGSDLVRDNGTLSATPAAYSGVNLSYANLGNNALTVTAANEFPSSFTGSVTVNKTGATITLNGIKTLTGGLTLTAGILDASASNYNLSLTGSWTNNAATTAFTPRSGTIILNGSSGQTIGGSFATSFNNLTNSNTSAAVSVNTNTNVSGILSMNGAAAILAPAATVVFNSGGAVGTISGTGTIQVTKITATADYVNQYKFSTNTLTSMTVDYTGAGAQTINSTVGNYGYLKTSTSGIKTLAGAVTVNNDITIGSSTTLDVSSGNYQITVGGNWANSGTFTAQAGAVLFNAATTGKTLSGTMTSGSKFNILTFNGSGGAWSFGANAADAGDDFTITAGTVTAPSSTLQVAGSWSNSGTFTNNGGTVVMNAATTGETLSGSMTGTNKFNVLTFNGSGGAWSFGSNPADVGSDFTITAGTVTAPSTTLQVAGNWSNNGTFAHNSGMVTFNRTGAQTISGSATAFNNLTIGSGSITTISTAGQTIKGILQSNNTLNAGGNLTLLSTSAQTAVIDGSGTGSVLGNVTMQRYLDSSYGYRYISSPFTAATLGELSGFVNLSTTFPLFYSYDESVNYAGWVIDTAIANTLSPLKGYSANFGTATTPVTIALTGVVNNGTQTVTLFNHNNTYTLGYNLVGNPYPSPIDWTAASGWTRTNIDNAIYYFNHGDTNQYYGSYSSYISGVSSDGVANNIIPAMQGFFVHVTNGTYPVTGTLTSTNAVRLTNLTPHYHKTSSGKRPLVRLDAGFSSDGKHSDPTVIYFDDMATPDFDKELDALKLLNTDVNIPSFYSVSYDENNLSIQALPQLADSMVLVPLGLQTAKDGLVTFNVRNIDNMPAGMHVWFYDTKTKKGQDLQTDPEYQVQLGAGKYENRFFLMFTTGNMINIPGVNGELNAYTSGGSLFVYLTAGKGELVVTNMAGQIVKRQQLANTGYNEVRLQVSSGVYIATLYSNMGKQSKKIFIGNQ